VQLFQDLKTLCSKSSAKFFSELKTLGLETAVSPSSDRRMKMIGTIVEIGDGTVFKDRVGDGKYLFDLSLRVTNFLFW